MIPDLVRVAVMHDLDGLVLADVVLRWSSRGRPGRWDFYPFDCRLLRDLTFSISASVDLVVRQFGMAGVNVIFSLRSVRRTLPSDLSV